MPTNPFFQGASAGVAASFSPIVLPPVTHQPGVVSTGTGAVATEASPWRPSLDQLLNGNTLIQTEAQMIDVWGQLFSQPFDPTLFEFSSTFVVLMGGGTQPPETAFEVSAVERVTANYPRGEGFFLSVIATISRAGPPSEIPGPALVSAVKVSRPPLSDIVFHRELELLPGF